MAIHPDFPESPYAILDPSIRWFPAPESSRESLEKLLPPLVHEVRKQVKAWRDSGYKDASETSQALLKWWFKTDHSNYNADGTTSLFQYYYAQREAVESVIYVYEVQKLNTPTDLLVYDRNDQVRPRDFDETWRRLVIKMATGSGKTKVMSLLVTWSYFHKIYELDSRLSRNFLIIAPNIIVLERLRADFDGGKIFVEDPLVPDNGFEGRNWKADFQVTTHIQDSVNINKAYGNIFLTNIQRVYESKQDEATAEDEDSKNYYLGNKPSGKTTDSQVDLDQIVRDVDELMVLNDEAHHIHDKKLAWFKSIQDIHNNLVQKDKEISLQIDLSATPKRSNGAIFVQTISDYPLVEAIKQNVVKHPVLPDEASRAKLLERQSANFVESFRDHLHLGYLEWKKAYGAHEKLGSKSILFVMTDDTKNCDQVAQYLESTYEEFNKATLVIHTNQSGDITEKVTGKKKTELDELRKQANKIDGWDSKYKAIVSVLMLKEGWDVKNVSTVVGLRSFSTKSKILPEQTLGRGLRKMYPGFTTEKVSVIGTSAFMEFIEGIQHEGVELEYKPMDEGTPPNIPLIIEVDEENKDKDLIKLDIKIPILTPRNYREYKDLNELDLSKVDYHRVEYKKFTEEECKEIVFKDLISGEIDHVTQISSITDIDYRNVVAYFARKICMHLHMQAAYPILYEKVAEFIKNGLFNQEVEIDNPNTLRNLSEVAATRVIIDVFTKAINDLTIRDRGNASIKEYISLRDTPTCAVPQQDEILIPHKSLFNIIIGDNKLEIAVAKFLDGCPDIISFAKNLTKIGFHVDYVNTEGEIKNYYPDFFVKKTEQEYFLIETKGREDIQDALKLKRLASWCEDVNNNQSSVKWDFVFIEEKIFYKNVFNNFDDIVSTFTKFK